MNFSPAGDIRVSTGAMVLRGNDNVSELTKANGTRFWRGKEGRCHYRR